MQALTFIQMTLNYSSLLSCEKTLTVYIIYYINYITCEKVLVAKETVLGQTVLCTMLVAK